MRLLVALVVGSLILVGCSSAPTNHRNAVAPPARAECATPTRFGAAGAPNEIRGVSRDAELWGLALGRVPPRAGDELKVVWRMTGAGPLGIVFTAPDGRRVPLVFGPEPHTASSYHRPGDEWGTGFRFTERGCWHIHLTRDDATADVWLRV